MKKRKNLFFKVGSLLTLLVIPSVLLTSCGSPTSNKYLTAVAQFKNLLKDPNNPNSEKIQVNYSFLVRSPESAPQAQWSYMGEPTNEPNKPTNEQNKPSSQPLTSENIDPLFTNVYGSLVNTIAYNIARPASTFATTVAGYNNTLPVEKQMKFFEGIEEKPTPENPNPKPLPQDIVKQFYQALSNNLMIANGENNIGFSVSDITFNFKEINPLDGKVVATGGTDEKGTIDARKNIPNKFPEIKDPYVTADGKPSDTANPKIIEANNEAANRLVKIFAITDIAVYFRFFIAGIDQGTTTPPRSQIVQEDNPNTNGKISNEQKTNEQILKEAWRQKFNDSLNTIAFKLSMHDMIGTMRYSVKDITNSNNENANPDANPKAKQWKYEISPIMIQSLVPASFYNNPSFALANGTQQNNDIKISPSLLSKLANLNEILTTQEFSNEDVNDPATFRGYQTLLNAQSNAFLNEINSRMPNVNGLKEKILQPTLKPFENQNNKLNFTIEDYFKAYFIGISNVDNVNPFSQTADTTKPKSHVIRAN